MSNEKLTMRLAGGAVVTFTSKEQKERFIKNHFHNGTFIHGLNAIQKTRNGYYFAGEKIPTEITRSNNFKRIEDENNEE